MTEHADGVLPPLHVVTDDRILAADGWLARARSVLEAGCQHVVLHVRGPGTPGRTLFELVRGLAPDAARTGASLTVNDRVDVALAAGLASVHLGVRSLGPTEARALLGGGARIGASCHGSAELAHARSEGADYVFAGNVFRTASHPESEAKGVTWFGEMVAQAGGTPLVAIGGVTPDTAPLLVALGAGGVAVLGGVWGSPDPAEAVADYIATLTRAFEEAHGGD